jgi:hypothetical protein
MNRTSGIVVLVSVALLSVAGLAAAYFFTHKSESEPPDLIEQARAAEIAASKAAGHGAEHLHLAGPANTRTPIRRLLLRRSLRDWMLAEAGTGASGR